MTINYTIENDGQLVVERFSGTIQIQPLVEHIDRLATHSGIASGAVNVADFRSAEIADFNADELELLVAARTVSIRRNRISKLALLINDVSGFELGNRYETLMRQAGVNVLVSSSMETICRFMALDVATIEAHLLRLG